MQKHTKIYIDHFGYTEQEWIPCEVCGAQAVDVHHIELKGMGGSKTKDHIENLIGLCRECHMKAHRSELSKEYLQEVHNNFLNSH